MSEKEFPPRPKGDSYEAKNTAAWKSKEAAGKVNTQVKVCVTSPHLFPSVVGGAERYVYCLARSLRKMGLDVVVITSKPTNAFAENPFRDINVVFLKPVFQIGVNPVTPMLLNTIMRQKPDIVHTQAPATIADLSLLSCKLLRIPIISTYHASITKSSVPYPLLALYNALHHEFTLRRCDHIITTTSRYMATLREMGLPEHRISVVPVGIEKDFVEAKVSKRAKEQFESRISKLEYGPTFMLLFVGALDSYHMYKGVDNLLSAFKIVVSKYPDSLLIIIGDGDRRPFYETLCRKLGLFRNTIFMGNVSKEMLITLYSLSNLLILTSTSFSEGFGTVLLEAMSRGCPVITTKYAGGSEVVQHEEAGVVVNSADPFSISEAIVNFIENDSLAKRCGKSGLRAVRQKYTWEALSSKILEIYERYTFN